MRREISLAFQTDKSASDYIALAKMIDQYTFDRVSVYCDAPFHPNYGPLLLMAPHIRRARLGPAAVSPSRIHPIDIAAETALLAQVEQGGVDIGIARGPGWQLMALPRRNRRFRRFVKRWRSCDTFYRAAHEDIRAEFSS